MDYMLLHQPPTDESGLNPPLEGNRNRVGRTLSSRTNDARQGVATCTLAAIRSGGGSHRQIPAYWQFRRLVRTQLSFESRWIWGWWNHG